MPERGQSSPEPTWRDAHGSLSSEAQHPTNDVGHTFPIFGLGRELFPTSPRDGIELRLAVVLGGAPLSAYPALLHEANEAEINRALVHSECVSADLLDPERDAISVHRPECVKSLQHHQIERALENVRLAI